MALETIKEGRSDWNTSYIYATCPICGCECRGKVNDGFTILTDNPRYYRYQYTCPTCGNEIKM